jgi:uncharacterized protein involved in oxidation of intracellular sulfur
MTIKNVILTIIICLTTTISIFAQTTTSCGDNKTTTTMKSNLGIVIYSNDTETVWNAFRLVNFSLTQKDSVKIFLLGKGVEAQNLSSDKFDVKKQMETFVAAGGQILACGTCLKIRNEASSDLCPISTMADLYAIIKQADKIITF